MSNLRHRVVVTQRHFDQATIDYLTAQNCQVDIAQLSKPDGNLTMEEIVPLLQGASGWVVGHAHVTRDLLRHLPHLKVIARRGVGYERIDVSAVRDTGKVATIAVGGNDLSVADHTIGLMLAVGRRFRETQQRMLCGDWTILLSTDLTGKTVGVIGAGRIGRCVIQRLQGFDVKVLFHAPRRDATLEAMDGVDYAPLDTIIKQSDYLTLHAPLTDTTRNIIDAKVLSAMKPTAFLINTSRGGLVDDRALLEVLKDGKLAGAGMDVYQSESDFSLSDVTRELIALPNVIATPHSAASSHEGLARTNMVAARSIVAVLQGGDPDPAGVIADGRRL